MNAAMRRGWHRPNDVGRSGRPTVLVAPGGVDDLVVVPDRDQKGEIRDMNAFSTFVVAAHMNELLAESAQDRLAKQIVKSQGSNRIAASVKSAWSLLSGSAEPTAVPKLTDYPYRS